MAIGNLVTIPGDLVTTNALQTQQINTNVLVANSIVYANGAPLVESYGNANVAAFLPLYGGNATFDEITGTLQTATQPYITQVGLLNTLEVTGQMTGYGNLDITDSLTIHHGNITVLDGAVGNIYTNANIVAKEQIYSGANIVAQDWLVGNYLLVNNDSYFESIFTDGYFYANGEPFIGGGGTITPQQVEAAVANVLPTYNGNIGAGNITVTGNTVTGNILTNNYYYANGVPVTFGSGTGNYGNSNVALYLATGNNTSNIATTGNIFANNIFTTGIVQSTGNIRAANFNTAGNVTAANFNYANGTPIISSTGDLSANSVTSSLITANAYFGGVRYDATNTANAMYFNAANGEFTYASASAGDNYGNANVINLLNNYGANNITMTSGNIGAGNIAVAGNVVAVGNVQGSYLFGNGAFITGLPANYGNAQVELLLETGIANNIITTGNVSAGNLKTSNLTINSNLISSANNITIDPQTGGADVGTLFVLGNLQVAGNVTTVDSNTITIDSLLFQSANNAINAAAANGGGLAVGPAGNSYATWTYDNAANSWASNLNITAPYFVGNGSLLTGMYGNAGVSNYLASGTANANITTTANISGSYLLGNGAFLTGLPATYGNANVSNYLASGTDTANITTTGNINAINFSAGSVGTNTIVGRYSVGTTPGVAIGGNALGQYSTALGTGVFNLGNITGTGPNGFGALAIGVNSYAGNAQVTMVGNFNRSANTAQRATAVGYSAFVNGNDSITVGNFGTINSDKTILFSTTATTVNSGANSAAYGTFVVSTRAAVPTISDGGTYIDSIKPSTFGNVLYYDPTTSEVSYGVATGGTGNYGDSNVATYLASGTNTSNIATSGNVFGTYLLGNASQATGLATVAYTGAYSSLTGLPTIPTNTNQLVNGNGFITTANANVISVNGQTGVVTIASYGNSNVATFLASGTNTSNVITTGNVSGDYILGNGAFLTGITGGVSTYGNANVSNYLASGTNSANISTLANVSGAYFIGNGSQLTGITAVSSYGNANVSNYLASGTDTGNIITTGNISGNYYIGNGSLLTGVVSSPIPSNAISATGTFPTSLTAYANAGGYLRGVAYNGANILVASSTNFSAAGGTTNLTTNSVVIGPSSAVGGSNSVAIGPSAGGFAAAANSVSIGFGAQNSGPNTSVVLNATGVALNGGSGGFFVAPVNANNANISQPLFYNASTKELTYSTTPVAGTGSVGASATSIARSSTLPPNIITLASGWKFKVTNSTDTVGQPLNLYVSSPTNVSANYSIFLGSSYVPSGSGGLNMVAQVRGSSNFTANVFKVLDGTDSLTTNDQSNIYFIYTATSIFRVTVMADSITGSAITILIVEQLA